MGGYLLEKKIVDRYKLIRYVGSAVKTTREEERLLVTVPYIE